jgi:hypothetical protein
LVFNPARDLNRLAESRYLNSQLPADQQVQSFLYPPEYELFDLQADPHEWKNLANSAEHKEYLHKPYKNPSFRWPHLDMFKSAQE